jgi:repressor LexA
MSPTARQMDVLRFIRGHQLAKGCLPTFDQIKYGIGLLSKSGVHRLLDGLEERGHVRRCGAIPRSIEVLTDIAIPRDPDGVPLYFVRLP